MKDKFRERVIFLNIIQFCFQFFTNLDYGYDDGQFFLSTHFVTIWDTISLLSSVSCLALFWIELRARR